MNAYLDTSGLNYFADNHPKELIDRLRLNGIKFYISSTTIWEILLNSNKERRELLIYWGQLNCEDKLLKSTSEILIDYYNLNCPEKDKTLFWDDPYTKLDLGETWTNIHGDISRTIPVELKEIKDFTRANHHLSKKFKSIIFDMTDPSYDKKESDYFYISAQKIAQKLDYPWNNEYQSHFIISTIVTCIVFCIGIELDKSLIRNFWHERNIEDPLDRLDYLISSMPLLFVRGPVAEMTLMVQSQILLSNSKSRGLLHDCFHLVYSYYSDFFLTNDSHFKELRDSFNHQSFTRIILANEIENLL